MDERRIEVRNFLLRDDISPEKHFWARDGTIIRNLSELEPAIDSMDDETFSFHVNEEKNDFSSWVRDVIGDSELAEQLSATRDKTRTQLLVLRRILSLLKQK